MCCKRLSVHRRRDVQKVNLKLHGQAKKNIRKKSVFFPKKKNCHTKKTYLCKDINFLIFI